MKQRVACKADCTFLPQYSLPPPCFLLLLIRAQRVYAMRLSEKAMLSETGICFFNAGSKRMVRNFGKCCQRLALLSGCKWPLNSCKCCQRLALFVPHLVTQDWPLGLRGSRCTKFGSNLVSYHECNTLHVAIRAHWH